MARLYNSGAAVGEVAILTDDAWRHARAHRLREGQAVELIDGAGSYWRGVLEGRGVRIGQVHQAPPHSPQLWLMVGLTQGGTFDQIVKQATELGVSKIIPLKTRYSAMGLDNERVERKAARWAKIALEACVQSGNYWQPDILPLTDINAAIDMAKGKTSIVASLGQPRVVAVSLAEITKQKILVVWVGPEGGFAPEEEEALRTAGAQMLTLGSTVLRVETAVVASLATVKSLTL